MCILIDWFTVDTHVFSSIITFIYKNITAVLNILDEVNWLSLSVISVVVPDSASQHDRYSSKAGR